MTFGFGVSRVAAFIAVGLVSALGVAAVKNGEPIEAYIVAIFILAPAAGVLHWLESWIAHDMAFRLLAEMRVALFKKIDKLAVGTHFYQTHPCFLLRFVDWL